MESKITYIRPLGDVYFRSLEVNEGGIVVNSSQKLFTGNYMVCVLSTLQTTR